jgi:hypothetical protein
MRKLIQIVATETSHPPDVAYGTPTVMWKVFGVCDDGSVWCCEEFSGHWEQLPELPQLAEEQF